MEIITGITFDVGATLLGVRNLLPNYYEQTDFFWSFGYDLSPQTLAAAYNYLYFWDYPRLQIDTQEAWIKQYLARLGIDDDQVYDAYKKLDDEYQESYFLFEDVKPGLRKLYEKGVKLSLLTTIPVFRMQPVFGNEWNLFAFVVTGSTTGLVKGTRKMYEIDLDKKGIDAQNNLFVGDDLIFDIKYPKRMRQQTGMIVRSPKHVPNDEVDYVFENVLEITDLID